MTRIMDLSKEPSSSEPLPDIPISPVAEPETKHERDDVYYFDTIVFEVCDYLWSPSGFV